MIQALADPERIALVWSLLEREATQADLRLTLDMSSGTASKQLGLLEARRLIARARSHAPYVLVAPEETAALLQAAADLAAAISRTQASVDERRSKELRKAGFRRAHGTRNLDQAG